MKVLVVEENADLSKLWCRHLERQGAVVVQIAHADDAFVAVSRTRYDVIVLQMQSDAAAAIALINHAQFAHPNTQVICVAKNGFFSDGTLFSMSSNACTMIDEGTKPEDLAAIVDYYGGQSVAVMN